MEKPGIAMIRVLPKVGVGPIEFPFSTTVGLQIGVHGIDQGERMDSGCLPSSDITSVFLRRVWKVRFDSANQAKTSKVSNRLSLLRIAHLIQ